VPCTCNPLKQGLFPYLRTEFVRSAHCVNAMTNGSRAIDSREPCQAGNRAALSGMFNVPRGSLFRAGSGVYAHKYVFDYKVYGLVLYLTLRRLEVRGWLLRINGLTFRP
jgi:hypothetical protein